MEIKLRDEEVLIYDIFLFLDPESKGYLTPEDLPPAISENLLSELTLIVDPSIFSAQNTDEKPLSFIARNRKMIMTSETFMKSMSYLSTSTELASNEWFGLS